MTDRQAVEQYKRAVRDARDRQRKTVDRGTTVLPDSPNRFETVEDRLSQNSDPSNVSISEAGDGSGVVAEYVSNGREYRQEFRFEDPDRLQNLRDNARARTTGSGIEYLDAVRYNESTGSYSDERQMTLVEETVQDDFGEPNQISVTQSSDDVYVAEAVYGDSTYRRFFSFGDESEDELLQDATKPKKRQKQGPSAEETPVPSQDTQLTKSPTGQISTRERERARDALADKAGVGARDVTITGRTEDGGYRGIASDFEQTQRDAVSEAVERADRASDAIDWEQAVEDPVGFLRGAGREREEALLRPISKYGDGARDAIDDINRRITPGDDVYTEEDLSDDVVGVLRDNKEGVATAAAAGVIAPEPASTVGGAVTLGGIAVAGLAADALLNQNDAELGIPEEGRQPEVDVPAEPASGTSEVGVPEQSESLSEVNVPEDGEMRQSEVDVPDDSQRDVLTISAAELASRSRQEELDEEEERTDPLADSIREMERSQRQGFSNKPPESYVDVDEGSYQYENWEPVQVVRGDETAGQTSDIMDATQSVQEPSVNVDVGSFGGGSSRPETPPLGGAGTAQDQGPQITDDIVTDVGADQQQSQQPADVVDQTPETDVGTESVTIGEIGTAATTTTPTATETSAPDGYGAPYPNVVADETPPADGYGYGYDIGFDKGRRPRRGAGDADDTRNFGSSLGVGVRGVAEDRFASGWYSETVTDIATSGQSDEDPLTQAELAALAGGGLGYGELPTAEMVRGDPETRDRIEDVESLLGFGSFGIDDGDEEETDDWFGGLGWF